MTTADTVAAPVRRRPPGFAEIAVAMVVLAVTVGAAARLPAPAGPKIAAVEVAFVSLFVEALPFLLIGAVISTLLRGRLGQPLLRAAAGRPRLAAAVAPLTGVALPVCDCGVLPIAREMRDGGVTRAVNAFIAGAPLCNPIVIISTLVAFPGSPEIAAGRVLAGLAVAMAVAALASPPPISEHEHEHDHDHDHDHVEGRPAMLESIGWELSRTAPALALGALLAAVIKGFIPTDWLTALAAQPLVAALAMMALAFVMSICSQADAFVAASLPVGPMPRLAFLVMGPVLDLRMSVMYLRTFGDRWLGGYAAVGVPMVLLAVTVCAVVGLV